MGRVEGKVAFVTGAARGQGRSHAVRLAEEGADIIAVDLCHDLSTIAYPLSRPEDLDETARLVEKAGRTAVTAQGDVREASQLRAAIEQGIAALGKLDIVVAQAGVMGAEGRPELQAWSDVINTNLVGSINAIQESLPHLREGASIIAVGSTSAMMDFAKKDNPGATRAERRTSIPSAHCLPTSMTSPPSSPHAASVPTLSIRPTSTPRCSRVTRCTACFDPTWSTPLAKTRSPYSLCNKQ